MMTPLLTALTIDSGSGQTLSQASQTIQGYVSWLEAQPSTMAGDQSVAVDTVKNHASNWYNSIYPTYLNMPSLILNRSAEITKDLGLLVQLAAQYQSGSIGSLDSAIQSSASNLQQAIQSIAQQTSELGQALQTFGQNLSGDSTLISNAWRQLQSEYGQQCNNLSSQYGQLQHLQSAACPSQTDISECEKLITQTTQAINNLRQGLDFLGAIEAHFGGVTVAANYLGTYWMTVSADASNCLQGLSQLVTNPATITRLNLSGAQTSWNMLIQTWQP